jgi:hypothetical protein
VITPYDAEKDLQHFKPLLEIGLIMRENQGKRRSAAISHHFQAIHLTT